MLPMLLAYVAVPYLVTLAISIALSAAAYFLLRPKGGRNRAKEADFNLTTVATQGAYVPLLIGRRRIGCVIAWVGDRFNREQGGGGGGKGFGGGASAPGQTVYYQSAWHLLCVGPALKLYRIWIDGKLVYEPETPLDAINNPSGDLITTPVGSFYLYWGETSQPVNTHLADASRVGVASRWPGVCSLVWIDKELGASPHWGQFEYDVESRPGYFVEDEAFTPQTTTSTVTDAQQGGVTYNGIGANFTITDAGRYKMRDGVRAWWRGVLGDPENPVFEDGTFVIEGTALDGQGPFVIAAFGTMRVKGSTVYTAWIPFEMDLVPGTLNFSHYFSVGGDNEYSSIHGGSGFLYYSYAFGVLGTLVKLEEDVDVHSIDNTLGQILFAAFPHGMGLDPDTFDMDSFAAADAALVAEGLTDQSVLATDGAEAGDVIAQLMQDAGLLWIKDYTNPVAQEAFYLVRQESDPLPTLPADIVLPTETEIEVLHADKAVDRIMFSFPDVARQFRDTVISIDEDGQPLETGNVRGSIARIGTVTGFAQAAIVAERRSQEELAGGARFTVFAGRDSRLIKPGQAIRAYGVSQVLRVVEVSAEALSSRTKLDCILDHYGAPSTAFEHDDDSVGSSGGSTAPAANLLESWIEIPEAIGGQGRVRIAGLRLRAHDQIAVQNIYFSVDGSTYKSIGEDSQAMTGGELTSELAADADWVTAQGPTFDLLGPDVDVAQDLSADDAAWQRGDQVCVIGGEVFFLQKITALGGDSYRLDGLIRARYETDRATHAIGAGVFIFPAGGLTAFVDAMAQPGATLYVKQQPESSVALDLTDVTAVSRTVYGKGLVPPPPCALRVTAPRKGSASYRTGEDVTFAWASRIASPPEAGMGLHGIGTQPVGVGALPANTVFEVKVYDSGDLLVATYEAGDGVTSTGWTYANADLQSDLGGETDFSIEVRQIQAGYRSSANTLAVTAL